MTDKGFLELIPGVRYTVRSKTPGQSVHPYVASAATIKAAETIIDGQQALHPERDYYITEERIVGHRKPTKAPPFTSTRDALEQAVDLLTSCTDDEFDEDGWAIVNRLRAYVRSL